MYQYACNNCGLVEEVPERLEPGHCWVCDQCEVRSKELEKKPKRTHCWHSDGDRLPTKPASYPEKCCFCGKKRGLFTQELVPREEHGPNLISGELRPKWGREPLDEEECPVRIQKGVASHA